MWMHLEHIILSEITALGYALILFSGEFFNKCKATGKYPDTLQISYIF